MAEQASERVNSESVAVAGQSGSLPTEPAIDHIRDGAARVAIRNRLHRGSRRPGGANRSHGKTPPALTSRRMAGIFAKDSSEYLDFRCPNNASCDTRSVPTT